MGEVYRGRYRNNVLSMDEVIGSSNTSWGVVVMYWGSCRGECNGDPLMGWLLVLLPKTSKGSANLYHILAQVDEHAFTPVQICC